MTTDLSNTQEKHLVQAGGNFLENLTVRWKLNILIVVMALGIIGVFITSLRGMQNLRSYSSSTFTPLLNQTHAIIQAESNLADIQVHIEALNDPNITSEEQSSHFLAIENAKETVTGIIENYKTKWLTTNNPEFTGLLSEENQLGLQKDEVATVNNVAVAFNDFVNQVALFEQDYTHGVYNNELASASLSALQEARNQLSHLTEINNEYANLSTQATDATFKDIVIRLIIALVLAISYGYMVSYSTAKSLSSRLNIVENAAIAYQNGYLDRRSVIEVGGNDEISRLARAFNKLFGQMQETLFNLEDRVRERTASLAAATKESERRAKQFEAITLVGSAISSIRSLDDLLPKITELISQQFSYYHVGIFLNDANNENAILSAANSEGGKQMLSRGHQLKIGEQGIVGYAISTGSPRIALDVGADAVYFGNPELPNTRSEMALPLKIGKDVVGALDVQSTEASAFGEEDISVLSLLADQVSLAIENARLFDQARKSLAESEALYRQYLRQAWNRLPKEQNLAGFRYDARGASPIETKLPKDTVVYKQEAKGEINSPCISVPIAIRGETIGMLSVQIPDEKNINENQMDLVNAVAERVALSAENARLFEETTRRAERERLVSDITVKIRSTNDPDAMIRIALEELKQALGASKVQLVPHSLQKSDTRQHSEIPITRNPSSKSVKK
jgi:GAF domain-containing protein/HAMP domain-containing protein